VVLSALIAACSGCADLKQLCFAFSMMKTSISNGAFLFGWIKPEFQAASNDAGVLFHSFLFKISFHDRLDRTGDPRP